MYPLNLDVSIRAAAAGANKHCSRDQTNQRPIWITHRACLDLLCLVQPTFDQHTQRTADTSIMGSSRCARSSAVYGHEASSPPGFGTWTTGLNYPTHRKISGAERQLAIRAPEKGYGLRRRTGPRFGAFRKEIFLEVPTLGTRPIQ